MIVHGIRVLESYCLSHQIIIGSAVSDFFADYWTEKGGTLLEQVNYSASTNDFTQLLKPSLQIDLSEARGLQIKRFVNSRVNYAEKKTDIDLVVMLGYPLKSSAD